MNAPYLYTQVAVRVEEVIAGASGPPTLPGGAVIDVEFYGDPSLQRAEAKLGEEIIEPYSAAYVNVGDVRVAFLRWAPFPHAERNGPEVWMVDPQDGFWGADTAERVAIPGSRSQQDELKQTTAERRWEAVEYSEVIRGIPFSRFGALKGDTP